MKEHGVKVYLATNPIFPRVGTMNRIRWAGIDAEDFEVITTYETYHYCKPNPKYFQEVMEEFRLNPKECLMVGNDVQEDLTIRSLGVKTYLLTDTLENKKNIPLVFILNIVSSHFVSILLIVRKNKTIFFFITFSSGLQPPKHAVLFYCLKLAS